MGQKGPVGLNSAFNRKRDAHLSDEPEMPKGLSREAKAEWRRITRLLAIRSSLDALDQVALHDYITCWERLRECEAEITANGVMVEGVNGRGRVKNPACQIARQYRDALLAWSREFGLTLSSRTRLDLSPDKAQAEAQRIEEMLSRPRKRPMDPIEAALCGDSQGLDS